MGALKFRFRAAFGRKFGMVYSDKVARVNANFLRIAISHIMRIRRNPIRTYTDIQRTGRWTPTRPTSIASSTYQTRLINISFNYEYSARCTGGGTRTLGCMSHRFYVSGYCVVCILHTLLWLGLHLLTTHSEYKSIIGMRVQIACELRQTSEYLFGKRLLLAIHLVVVLPGVRDRQ